MMRPVAVAALLAVASAEPMVAGGTLKLSWSDCGGVHGKATSIEPAELILGQATNIIGKGSVDEAISAGAYEMKVNAGIIPLLDHKGDLCKAESISLPGGVGTMQWKGLSCPLTAGPVEIDLTITLSAAIPASLARTSIKLTGTGSNGDNLLCIQLNTAPEEVHEARAAHIVETPYSCPHSPAFIHAWSKLTTWIDKTCAEVQAEIKGRVAGAGGWIDPHNKGHYSVLSEDEGANSLILHLQRQTANGQYTDKIDLEFQDSGTSCAVKGCSQSQVTSVMDYSTNFCNIRMLTCGSGESCKPATGLDWADDITDNQQSVGNPSYMIDCMEVTEGPVVV